MLAITFPPNPNYDHYAFIGMAKLASGTLLSLESDFKSDGLGNADPYKGSLLLRHSYDNGATWEIPSPVYEYVLTGTKTASYEINDNYNQSVHDATWIAETFLATVSGPVDSAEIYASVGGAPGVVVASIRAIGGDNKPTGPDLCSGSVNANAWGAAPAWRTFTLSPQVWLEAGTKYVIILRAPSGSVANYVNWRTDLAAGYPDGLFVYSTDSGATWTVLNDRDCLFRIKMQGSYVQPGLLYSGGTIYCFFCSYRTALTDCRLYIMKSTDDGATWSLPEYIEVTFTYNASRSDGIELSDGTLIFPFASWDGARYQCGMVVSTDGGTTWVRSAMITRAAGNGVDEPTIVERSDGSVYCLMRNDSGHLYYSVSTDDGMTWSASAASGLVSPDAPACLHRVSSSLILVCWDNSAVNRYPLDIAASLDDCATWSAPVVVTNPGHNSAYPCMQYVSADNTVIVAWWDNITGPPPIDTLKGEKIGLSEIINFVITFPASNVQANQATGNGYLEDGTNIDQIGFEWGLVSGGPYPNNVGYTGAISAGDFSLDMTGLAASTPYYYRARAHSTVSGWIYGAEQTFTTTASVPMVTTSAPSSVLSTSATGNGNITSTGGDPACSKIGFVYGLTSHGDPGNVAPGVSGYDAYVENSGTFGVGAFNLGITGLTANKLYYMRAYSMNSFGYAYGAEVFFITNPNCNVLLPDNDYQKGIRFDTSPGGGYPHPYGGSVPHYVLCRDYDSHYHAGGTWGYLTGNYVYERNYYNDNYYTDLYYLTNPARQEEGIVKIKWKAHPLQNLYPYGNYKREILTHGVQYTGAIHACGISDDLVCEIFYTNPFTGLPWTLAEANDLIAGITVGKEGGYGIAACDYIAIHVLWANARARTDGATNLGGSIRRLFGTVMEDEGESATVYFEWGATAAYGNVTANQTKAKGDAFTADVDIGALPSIHYRAVIVTDCGETFYGNDLLFPALGPSSTPAKGTIPVRLASGGFI